MSWGTDFKADIYLSRQMYNGVWEVKDRIEEIDKELAEIGGKLKILSGATPKDIIPDEWKESPVQWINNEIETLLDDYQENLIHRYTLNLYLRYLEDENTDN